MGNGYGTIGKQHAGKLMGSNINSITMASTAFMFIHYLFFHKEGQRRGLLVPTPRIEPRSPV
jgi:hypothetical protein